MHAPPRDATPRVDPRQQQPALSPSPHSPARHQELLALSISAILGLLVAYHRTYDATLLALPIAWAIGQLPTPRRAHAISVLLLCAPYLLPTPVMLHVLAQQGRISTWLTRSAFREALFLRNHVWAIVLIVVVLLWSARRWLRSRYAGAADP